MDNNLEKNGSWPQRALLIGQAIGKGISIGLHSIGKAAETISEDRAAAAHEWQDRNMLRLAQENERDALAILQNAVSVTAPILGLYVTQGGQNYYRGIKVLNRQDTLNRQNSRRIPVYVFVVPHRQLSAGISTSEICSTLHTYMSNQTPAGRLLIFGVKSLRNSNSLGFILMWSNIYNFYHERGII